MNTPTVDHEKLFNDICNKLNELGQPQAKPNLSEKNDLLEQKFKNYSHELKELQDIVEYLTEKLELSQQQLDESITKLQEEKDLNKKLNQDLSKSLELSLKTQLELQESKSSGGKALIEEKKYSQSLEHKNVQLIQESELQKAINVEIKEELVKAKNAWNEQSQTILQKLETYEQNIIDLQNQLMQSEDRILRLNIIKNKAKLKFKKFYFNLNANYQNQLDEIIQQNNHLNTHVEELKKSNQDLTQKLTAETTQFSAKKSELEKTIQTKNLQLQELIQSNQSLNIHLEQNKKQSLEKDLKNEDKISILQNQIKMFENQVQQLRQERIQENQKFLSSQESRDQEIQKLHTEANKNQQTLLQNQETIKNLNNKIKDLSFEVDELIESNKKLEEIKYKTQDYVEQMMKAAENKMIELKITLDKKTHECLVTKTQLEKTQAELLDIKHQINKSYPQPKRI